MKTRILLVEDDERLADLTAEYLRKNDFEVAIEEGATIVRIGTALFGERKKT